MVTSGGIVAAGSTETIPLITNVATDKVTKHTQVKFTEPPDTVTCFVVDRIHLIY